MNNTDGGDSGNQGPNRPGGHRSGGGPNVGGAMSREERMQRSQEVSPVLKCYVSFLKRFIFLVFYFFFFFLMFPG